METEKYTLKGKNMQSMPYKRYIGHWDVGWFILG